VEQNRVIRRSVAPGRQERMS